MTGNIHRKGATIGDNNLELRRKRYWVLYSLPRPFFSLLHILPPDNIASRIPFLTGMMLGDGSGVGCTVTGRARSYLLHTCCAIGQDRRSSGTTAGVDHKRFDD